MIKREIIQLVVLALLIVGFTLAARMVGGGESSLLPWLW
jgi:hypothetical protein